MNNIISFTKNLEDITWATKEQVLKEKWNVSGILKKYTNKKYKFDLSPIKIINNDVAGKKFNKQNKAEKLVLETNKEWIILDIDEMLDYYDNKKIKTAPLNEIEKDLTWSIKIPK